MRTLRAFGFARAMLLLLPASAVHAETRLTWSCMAPDGSVGRQLDLVYFGSDVVPCKAYLHSPGGSVSLIADYDVTRGQCEHRVRGTLGSLMAKGYSCTEPSGVSLADLEARAEGTAPVAVPAPPAEGDLYFAIISRHSSEEAAQAAASKLRAADRSARPVILSPRDPGGSWLLALAAYTDAATAAKAVQYARRSGLGPDAYFWNVPRAAVASGETGGAADR